MRTYMKQLRKNKGWTQWELALKLGISVSYVKKLETGARNPTLKLVTQLATLLGCEVDDVLRAS